MESNTHNISRTEAMFSAIARRYDLCNHLFSFGMDFYWRRTAAKMACPETIANALDVCCGTGDMVFALAKTGRIGHITGCDISEPMLELARKKQQGGALDWVCAPAEKIDFADGSYDLITCAFGLRNVDDLQAAVSEMYRLLRPGGRVCVLEFFMPRGRVMRSVYSFYLGRMMPVAAKLIVGTDGPWRYLARSIQEWADRDCLTDHLQRAGFQVSNVRLLTFGTIQIHVAVKK